MTGTSSLTGNVGIGGASTTNRLEVTGITRLNGATSITGATTLGNNLAVTGTSALTGNVGIGIVPSTNTLEVFNVNSPSIVLRTSNNNLSLQFGLSTVTGGYSPMAQIGDAVIRLSGQFANTSSLIIENYSGQNIKFGTGPTGGSSVVERMRINGDGQVKIGTQTITSGLHTDYKLAVDGKIVAKSCYITNTGWADFVFDKNYKLQSLEEVEDYIKSNKHLPEIPSSKDIEENGINVSEVLKLQMQKIEELTLHLIEMKKELAKLKK